MNGKYLRPTNLYREARRRLEELYVAQSNLEKRLKTYPEGNLHIVKSKSGIQYYLRTEPNDKSGTYLQMNIPYKYECPLMLANGKIIHPDFTVLDITGRREIYWEHRGMMDDRIYLKHAVQRVKEYRKNGIYPGDNLLLTEETSTIPLGTDEIEEVIKHFLVSSTTDHNESVHCTGK